MTTELRNFEITYAIEKDLHVEQFAVGNKLTGLLNRKLKLNDYCETVSSLFVIFQCFDPTNEYVQVKEQVKFKRKTKVIELYMLLDYTKVKKADKEAMLRMMAESYLAGIEKLIQRKDFDVEKLQKDVSGLFKTYLSYI